MLSLSSTATVDVCASRMLACGNACRRMQGRAVGRTLSASSLTLSAGTSLQLGRLKKSVRDRFPSLEQRPEIPVRSYKRETPFAKLVFTHLCHLCRSTCTDTVVVRLDTPHPKRVQTDA